MKGIDIDRERIKGAWQGRISGCQLGRAVELLSMLKGRAALLDYLEVNDALPLRDYVPLGSEPLVELLGKGSCKGHIRRSEPDDDINYTVLALMMLEQYGSGLKTTDVAVSWLRLLPAGATFTAERAAYKTLLQLTQDSAIMGLPHNFDLSACSDNQWSEWIGAQIRADLYGWVCPGRPQLAADLARRDAALSHKGEGINGAAFVAAMGAAIPASKSMDSAVDAALNEIPPDSAAADAVQFARSLAGKKDAVEKILSKYKDISPVHTVNNLALVIWAVLSGENDFSAAIGEAVTAGWDTDCNGATVGGLWGLTGRPIPSHWIEPWQGRVAVNIAGTGELDINDLVERTIEVARKIQA